LSSKKGIFNQDICRGAGKYLKTGIAGIDSLGGLPAYEIIEICGSAGVGKSLLVQQLMISYMCIKKSVYTWYFDIDRTFNPEHLLKLFPEREIEDALSRVYLYSPLDFSDFIKKLSEVISLKKDSKDNLLIIDSIPNIFLDLGDTSDEEILQELQIRIVQIGELLRKFVKEQNTVIVINHVRSLVRKEKIIYEQKYFGEPSNLWLREGIIPALGGVWEYYVDTRYFLKKIRRDLRILIVVFSNSIPETFVTVKFVKGKFI